MSGDQQNKKDAPYQLRPRPPRAAQLPRPPRAAQRSANPAEVPKERNYEGLKLTYWSKLVVPRMQRYRGKIDEQGLTAAFCIVHGGVELVHVFYKGDPTQIATEDRGLYPCSYEFDRGTRVKCDAGFTCDSTGRASHHRELGSVTVEGRSIQLFVMLKNEAPEENTPQSPILLEQNEAPEEDMPPSPVLPNQDEVPEEMEEQPVLPEQHDGPEEMQSSQMLPEQRDDTILAEETPDTSKNEKTGKEDMPPSPVLPEQDEVPKEIEVQPVLPEQRVKCTIVRIEKLDRPVRIVRPVISDEPALKGKKMKELFRRDGHEKEVLDDSNDTILAEETPDTSRNEDHIIRRDIIIPETPDNSMDGKTRRDGEIFMDILFSRILKAFPTVDDYLSPEKKTRKTEEEDLQESMETLTERDEKGEDSFFEHPENRILHVFTPLRLQPPQLPQEGPQLNPVPVEVFYPLPNPTAASRSQSSETSIADDCASNVSSCSNRSNRKGPTISYLIPLIEELEKAGHGSLAAKLKIMDNRLKERDEMMDKSCHNYSYRDYEKELQKYWPDIHDYLQKINVIGRALRVNNETIHKVPTLIKWLNSAATERIFDKILLQWKARPVAKGEARAHAIRNYRRDFKKLYHNGDRDYFLNHGDPFPPRGWSKK